MNRITGRRLTEVGRFLAQAGDRPITIAELAAGLGCSYGAARRRLFTYAHANGLEPEASTTRAGHRGPESTAWRLRPVAEATFREAVLALLPRTPEAALTKEQLLEKARRLTPSPALLTRWLAALVADPHLGLVTTPRGRLYLDASTAKTTRIKAVTRKPPAPEKPVKVAPLLPPPELPAGLPPALVASLNEEERPVLAMLLAVTTARTTELAKRFSMSPMRVDGMTTGLRRKLRGHLDVRLLDETLSDGDTLYRLERGPDFPPLLSQRR